MLVYIHNLSYYKLFLYFSLCLSTQIKLNEQHVERKDMNENEQERLSNKSLRHKLK
jgi:hypothetical protein